MSFPVHEIKERGGEKRRQKKVFEGNERWKLKFAKRNYCFCENASDSDNFS